MAAHIEGISIKIKPGYIDIIKWPLSYYIQLLNKPYRIFAFQHIEVSFRCSSMHFVFHSFAHSFFSLHCCVCNLSRNVHTHQFTFIWTYESWRKTSKRHNKNQVYEGKKRLNETTNDNKANPIGGHKQWIERNNDTSHAQRYRFGSSLNSCELFILWIYIKTDCAKERKVFFINIKTEFKSEMLVSSLCRPNRI